jgi:hypothetical protein
MKAIIRWEQLNKKPFSLLNYNSEDDIISLFYSCTLSDQIHISLDDFKNGLTPASAKRMIQDFEKHTSLISQFQAESKQKEGSTQNSEPTYIKDVVAMLVMNGLDVYFALNQMELCDLPIFINAYDQKVKDSLESSRLWTFIQVSPHLPKNIKSPKDLYHFPWEITKDAAPEVDMEEAKGEFKSFFQTGNKQA